MECPRCGSDNVIRYGTRNNKQNWKCKECGRYFTHGKRQKKKDVQIIYNYSLGYVIGVLVGDGCISKWKDYHYFDEKHQQVPKAEATNIVPRYRYGFQLQCKDKDFIEAFAKHLSQVSGREISPYPIKRGPLTEIAGNKLSEPYTFKGWKVQLTFKRLYKKLKPLVDNLEWVLTSKPKVKEGFLRGLFDSDGGTSERPRIHLTNSNMKLLKITKQLLEDFNIKGKIYPQGPIFRLNIGSLKNAKKFYKSVGFSIDRKKREFER